MLKGKIILNLTISFLTMEELTDAYQRLINIDLPARYTFPVRFNHCFNRIILDWLFQDCWYHHLDRKKTAISQLTQLQIKASVERMNQWMKDQKLLISDNSTSLSYREKIKEK